MTNHPDAAGSRSVLAPSLHAVAAGLSGSFLLAVWNVVQVALTSRPYRDDPSRAAELLLLAFTAYVPLVLVPLLLLLACARVLKIGAFQDSRRAAGWIDGAVAGVTAAVFSIGILAPRGPRVFLTTAPSLLDSAVAFGSSIACAVVAARLSTHARTVPVFGTFLRTIAGSIAGVPLFLLSWTVIRDRIGAGTGRIGQAAIAAALLVASITAGIGLVELGRFASRTAGRLATLPAKRLRRGAAGAGISLALMAGALAAGRSIARAAAATPASADRPNVLIIVADALRADHVGCYGAARVKTPALDALAARGTRVEKTYASSSWTGPATASILTGLYPGSHGLMTYRDRQRDDAISVAEVFARAGYATAGIAANPVLSEKLGFGSGFDLWEEEIEPGRLNHHRGAPIYATLTALSLWPVPEIFPRAEEVVLRAVSWLERRGPRPFFLYLHFMDPHDPYAPPPPFDTMYARAGAEPLRMQFGTLPEITQGTYPVGPEDLDRLLSLYDGAISYMDGRIGELLETIDRLEGPGRTIVVFTADHGEEFNEHGGLGHEHTLYEELVRIPLIVAGPGIGAGAVIEGPVRQIDIAPTILDAAGLSFPQPPEGASILTALASGGPAPERDLFLEEAYIGIRSPFHAFRAIRQGSFKLIGSSFHVRGGGPWRWEMYDLASDPGEKHDLSGERAAEAAAMRERIEVWAKRPRAGRVEEVPLDEEMQQKLKALGYVQ